MKRRDFIVKSGCGVIAGLGSSAFGKSISNDAAKGDAFCFFLLGDLHYDRLIDHDFDLLSAGHRKQIEHYSRATLENSPFLIEAMKKKISASTMPVPYIIQLGDFTQGLCGSEELATQQLTRFTKWIDDHKLGSPFVVIKGNHDITGPGAKSAYSEVVFPWQSKILNRPIETDCYFFRHKNVLIINFYEHNPNSLEWLLDTLEEEASKSEHVIVLSHAPFIANSARAHWGVYLQSGKRVEDSVTAIEALGRHKAILLTGHLHKYSVLSRKTPQGGIVQLALSSIMKDRKNAIQKELITKDYGLNLINAEPGWDPKSLERRKEIIENEKPHIQFFEYANAPGYAQITVKGKDVSFEMYAGPNFELYKKVNVSKLLEGFS